MSKKVAVNKIEIDKLIRFKKYDEAKNFIVHIRDVIELVSINRVNILIENEAILESEKSGFIKMIQNNIIAKLLEDEDYILIDETYVDIKRNNYIKLRSNDTKSKKKRKSVMKVK